MLSSAATGNRFELGPEVSGVPSGRALALLTELGVTPTPR
jgi:hypothetical protein